MGKQLKPLQQRKLERTHADAKLKEVLVKAKKRQKQKDLGNRKRKSKEVLARFLALPLDTEIAVRPASEYKAKHYRLEKQLWAFLDHLFVQYPVPVFMFRAVLSNQGVLMLFPPEDDRGTIQCLKPQSREIACRWFETISKGGSLAALVAGQLSKREAHHFLQAPSHLAIRENLLWAKAAAAGVPPAGCELLVRELDEEFRKALGSQLPELLRIYAQGWNEFTTCTFTNINRFLRKRLKDPNFSLKGRTIQSLRKMRSRYRRRKRVQYDPEAAWPRTYPLWKFCRRGLAVRAVELVNGRELNAEGAYQRHCVGTYLYDCQSRESRIVSFRWDQVLRDGSKRPLSRITVEIWVKYSKIWQVRGKNNRRATDEEWKVIELWANHHRVKIDEEARNGIMG